MDNPKPVNRIRIAINDADSWLPIVGLMAGKTAAFSWASIMRSSLLFIVEKRRLSAKTTRRHLPNPRPHAATLT
jgi:hypothetical protein